MDSPHPSDYSPKSSASNFADDEYESSMASSTSTNRPGSVYSYHSSVDGQVMLKDVYGRTINNTSERYGLPADPAEHARLDVQHLMLKTKLNGLFVPLLPVRRALAPRQSTTPSILDLGTGSGSWAIDMAKLFPHADVVGLDLVPANLNSEPPLNCRFECDDINLGLLHYKNSFDVVHARCISLGIEDYPKFLGEVIEVLRPGGVYLAGAGDIQLYNEDRSPVILPDNEDDPSQRSNIDSHPRIGEWIREKGDEWDDTGEKVYWVALGPWEADAHGRDRRASELMRQNFLGLLQSARPLILSHGYFESSVDRWINKAQEEMNTMRRRLYVKWRFYWAIKPGSSESSDS